MKIQIATLEEEKRELDKDVKSLTNQITILCTQVPELIKSIEGLKKRIDLHEDNAVVRSKEGENHRLLCNRVSVNVKIIWMVIGFIFTLIGVLFKIK